MDRTIYYVWRGVRVSDDLPNLEAAMALADDGDQVYRETTSGTRHERNRVWPTAGDTESWDTQPKIYHD